MGRGVAVVLFTDLVGSTELRARLGEVAADELRRTHDRLLTEAVEANSGRVVKGLGDGIMATFSGASDAVAAAVAIQQAIDRLNRSGKAPVPLVVRVGLSAGDVTFEADDVHGTPVIEAARLCAVATGGEILVSEVVRLLAGGAGSWALAVRGPLELKGLAAPLSTWEVRWEPARASTIPMPALLTDIGRIFVGRDAEIDRLTHLWKEAAAGERRVALLAGEPGVGKTRLAAELALRVHEDGGVILAGRCDEHLGVPYQPVVEALRHFVDHTPAGDLPARLGRYGGELSRLVPELATVAPGLAPPLKSDPETERYRLFDAVAAWLAAVSDEGPVLLVLDDLQWAAKPTLLVLRHLLRSSLDRLMVIGTYRDSELTHDHALVQMVGDLRRQEGVERVALGGLDDREVAAFVAQVAGRALDAEGVALARVIHAETEGNPFFVREVLRHLVETGTVERGEDGWTTRVPITDVGLPEGVRDVVGRRLARLSQAGYQALGVAAVVGAEFDLAVVQRAGGLGEDAVLSALDEAATARLIVDSSATHYRFSHALVRATLYEALTAGRKVALHRRVAEAIETLYGAGLDDHLPALAYHWARASTPAAETAKAVGYACRAGERALAQLAHDEAAAYYQGALDLLRAGGGDQAGEVDLLIRLGEVQRQAGDPAHRRTLLDAADLARGRRDTGGLVRAALANSRAIAYSRVGELDPERIAVLETALNSVGEADVESRARLMANLAVELVFVGDRDRRVALSDAALAAARASGDDAVLAHVLMTRYYTILAPDTLGERLANTGELVETTERLGDPFIAAMAWFFRVRTAMETGDVDEADRCLATFERYADDLRQPFVRWVAQFSRTGRELLAGRYDSADRMAAAALETGRAAGQHEALLCFTLERFQTQVERDDLRDAQQTLAEAGTGGFRLPLLDTLRAIVGCELDQMDEARCLLATLAHDCFAGVPVNNLWLSTLANCAAIAARLADADRSGQLYGILGPYANQLPVALLVPSAALAYYLGMLAAVVEPGDAAEGHFSMAEAIHDRIGAPVWLARTRLEWARMLLTRRRTGDIGRAGALLGQALDTAREFALANIERRAAALLQECP